MRFKAKVAIFWTEGSKPLRFLFVLKEQPLFLHPDQGPSRNKRSGGLGRQSNMYAFNYGLGKSRQLSCACDNDCTLVYCLCFKMGGLLKASDFRRLPLGQRLR